MLLAVNGDPNGWRVGMTIRMRGARTEDRLTTAIGIAIGILLFRLVEIVVGTGIEIEVLGDLTAEIVRLVPLRSRIEAESLPGGDDMAKTLFLQDPLHTLDGIAFAIEQAADSPQQFDVVGAIIAATTAALHRLDLGKPGFPEPQDMLWQVEFLGHLTDRPERVRTLGHQLSHCGARFVRLRGSLILGCVMPVRDQRAIDPLLEDVAGLENHHAARRDRNFLARLRIAPDALALGADQERSERRQFDRFAPDNTRADLVEDRLDQFGGFRSRQPHLLIHRLTEVGARDSLA